jgi:hypothetical protein
MKGIIIILYSLFAYLKENNNPYRTHKANQPIIRRNKNVKCLALNHIFIFITYQLNLL